MSVLILDPLEARAFRRRLRKVDERFTECWNGRLVVPPLPNRQHQAIAFGFAPALHEAVVAPGAGQAYLGVNVSDRATGWKRNFRGPDVAVYLNGNPAVAHPAHMQGGPDFLVEILSRGERPKAKFRFYARIGTREVLLLYRRPSWVVELFQLQAGKLELVGRSDLATPTVLASGTIPLAFQVVAGASRPQVLLTHPPTGRQWWA